MNIKYVYDKYGYKKKYLDMTKGAIPLFKNCGYFEEKIIGKDLCEFTQEDFTKLVSYLLNEIHGGLEMKTVLKDFSFFKGYLKNCQDERYTSFYSDDIKAMTIIPGTNRTSVEKWLHNLSDKQEQNNLMSYYELLSLDDHLKSNYITKQALAVVWLLFIGLRLDELVSIKEEDTNNWNSWYPRAVELPTKIKAKVSSVLEAAKSEKSVPVKGEGARPVERPASKYLIKRTYEKSRKTVSHNKPASIHTIRSHLNVIRDVLKKGRLQEINIRKSGMLYFGQLLLRERVPKTKRELDLFVYKQLSDMFGENLNSYKQSFFDLFENDLTNGAFKTFYSDVTVPELERANPYSDKDSSNEANELPPRPPKERSDDDYRPWENMASDGKKGEELVVHWLEKQGAKKVKLAKDYYGYDIYAQMPDGVRLIEVKTMKNKHCSINLTKLEYRIAHKKEKYHWFYILVWDQEKADTPQLFVFKDLLELLKLRNKREKLFGISTKKELFNEDAKTMIHYNSFMFRIPISLFELCEERHLL